LAGLLRITDAAVLGIHALALMASAEEPTRVIQLARTLKASEAHMSKVMQRLARAGMVTSVRGPRGGFLLARDAEEVSLLEIYEALDGPVATEACLLARPACAEPGACAVRALNAEIHDLVQKRLGGLKLAHFDLSDLVDRT
jgi:Rrf2 family protein